MRSFSLDEVLRPATTAQFLAEYLGTNYLRVEGEPGRFEPLFPWGELNRILSTHRFGAKGLRLVKDGATVSADLYLRNGIVRAPEMTGLLREGATLVLEGVDCIYPPVTALAEHFERVFQVGIQINLYAGWRVSHGFNVHWDDHDVIVLQIAGRKQWKVYGATEQFPVKNSVELRTAPPTSDPLWDGLLNDGDVLYLPRGWWHIAIPCDEPTLHLTVGLHYPNGLDIVRWVTQDLERDVRLRRDVPVARDPGNYMTDLQNAVVEAFAEPGLLERYLKHHRGLRYPRPSLGLPSSATPQVLPESEDSIITIGVGRQLELESQDGAIGIEFNGRALTFAAAAKPLFDFLSDHPRSSIRNFYKHFAAQYENETLRQFLADLVKQGVIVLAEPQSPAV